MVPGALTCGKNIRVGYFFPSARTVILSPEWTSTTKAENYLLLDTEDLVTFCSFHNPFPYYRADSAIFFNYINYFAVIPYIASLDSLAKPFSSSTFLTSIP